jgi:hypothetical protein
MTHIVLGLEGGRIDVDTDTEHGCGNGGDDLANFVGVVVMGAVGVVRVLAESLRVTVSQDEHDAVSVGVVALEVLVQGVDGTGDGSATAWLVVEHVVFGVESTKHAQMF